MHELTQHTREYWKYEYDVSALSMIPLLRSWGARIEGSSVLDVGSAEGGGLCALYDQGAVCVGFDVDEPRIRAAEQLRGDRKIDFRTGNLYLETLPFDNRQFDLVMLHDVFEHLDRKSEVIARLKRYMKTGGMLLITFPPYYSAYGAHQQRLLASFVKIPFFHLIPFSMSFVLPRLRHEAPHIVGEVQKLGRLKMGMRKFERIAREGGLHVRHKRAYIVSPNHIRFGLRPFPAGFVAHLPVISELLCSGVVYLLSKD